MKIAIATLLSLIAAQTSNTFSTGAFEEIPGDVEAITIELFKPLDGVNRGNFKAIADCGLCKFLFDANERKDMHILVGLRFNDTIETHSPTKTATEEGVIDIYFTAGNKTTKRAFNGTHIIAQAIKFNDYSIYDYLVYCLSSGENAGFLKKSHISVPITFWKIDFDVILSYAKHRLDKVFVYIKAKDFDSSNFKENNVEIVAIKAVADKLYGLDKKLTINIEEKHNAKEVSGVARGLLIYKAK